MAGEGGALIIGDRDAFARAEIFWEKGTTRAQFKRREVDEYHWVDVGSSYLPSEITAAFLYAQIENADAITIHRLEQWKRYFVGFADLEARAWVTRPRPAKECDHNGHIFYLLLRDAHRRAAVLSELSRSGVHAISHYVPLHSAPGGIRFGRTFGSMNHTNDIAARLIRLPLHPQLTPAQQDFVIAELTRILAHEC